MKLSFFGDINFRYNEDMTFDKAAELLADIEPALEGSDFRLANLEMPLADKEKYEPIPKCGPNLINPANCLSFFKALKVDVALTANNHIGDYGEGALFDTLSLLDENGIGHIGSGANLDEAYKSVILEKDGVKVSVISVCENEFGLATENSPGSAAYSPRRVFKAITKEKRNADFVIVVFHGGNEYCPIPNPETVDRYRMLCDMGADAVVAMHTHCPQGYEMYDGKPIIYSLGNFMFQPSTPKEENNSWYYGYVAQLSIEKSKGITFDVLPYRFGLDSKIHAFRGEEKAKMLLYLEKLSAPIGSAETLHDLFMGWCYNHQRYVKTPEEYGNLKYEIGNEVNVTHCEAHIEVLKENYRILFYGEEEKAKEMSVKTAELSVMP